MSIKIGNLDVSYFKVGGADCSIYIGDVKMYPQGEPPTPTFDGKYQLTLSDSTTISAECDGTSAVTSGEVSSQYSGTVVSAEIGDCVTEIGTGAFFNCSGLTSIDIPDSVTTIGKWAFYNCSGLTSCTLGDNVTSIGNYAFNNCSGLTSIDIPDSVTSINTSAFYNCNGLTSCTIGTGVTSIGVNAFRNCTSLASVTVNATTPPTLGNSVFQGSTCPIYVLAESVETYKTASGWSTYADRIQAIV